MTGVRRVTRRTVLRYGVAAGLAAAVAGASVADTDEAAAEEDERTVLLRLALITDTHTNRGVKDDQPLYKGRFDRVIAAVNAERGIDTVLFAGDLAEGGRSEEWDDFTAQAKDIRHPVAGYVPGNHDVGAKRVPGKEGGVTAERVTRYEAHFGRSWWSKELAGGVRVVALNSPILGSGLPAEAEQWAWLEKELAPGRHKGGPTLLLTHYPPYLKTPDEASDPYWNVEPEPRARLLALLAKSGDIRAVLSGHLHRPLVNRGENGALLYTSPPVSFGLPKSKQPEGWTLVTVSRTGEVSAAFRPLAPTTEGAPA